MTNREPGVEFGCARFGLCDPILQLPVLVITNREHGVKIGCARFGQRVLLLQLPNLGIASSERAAKFSFLYSRAARCFFELLYPASARTKGAIKEPHRILPMPGKSPEIPFAQADFVAADFFALGHL